MPYTALQYLNLLAQYNRWQRMYAYPLHRGDRPSQACRLRAVRAETCRRRRSSDVDPYLLDGNSSPESAAGSEDDSIGGKAKKRSIIIFKRTGPGVSMNWYGGANPPCGLLGCPVCGVFLGMMVEELERGCPGLVEGGDEGGEL